LKEVTATITMVIARTVVRKSGTDKRKYFCSTLHTRSFWRRMWPEDVSLKAT